MENSTNEFLTNKVESAAESQKEKVSVTEAGARFAEGIKNLFSAKNRKKTCLILLAVIVVIGCIVSFSVYSSPKAVAERYLKASLLQDNAVVSKLTAYDFKEYSRVFVPYASAKFDEKDRPDDETLFEKCSNWYDEDISSWNELFAVQNKLQIEEFEDEWGEFKVTVEVTREKNISSKKAKSELADWLEMIEDLLKFDPDVIDECKVITAKIKLIGEDETDRGTAQVYLCKVDGAWKVLYHGE